MDNEQVAYDYDDFIQKTGDYDFEDDEPLATDLIDNEGYDEEQLLQQQQLFQRQLQLQHQQAAAQLPDAVRNFILYFHHCLKENNVYDLHGCYENSFNRLTEKFYKNTPWPDPHGVVAALVNNDQPFVTLYTEMYYRHLYAKLQPTLEDRFASYDNYCIWFNYIFDSSSPADMELPTNWAWDVIDEFIYQFNSFALYRSRIVRKSHNEEEIQQLRDHPQTWSTYTVLNVLYSFIQKSRINEQLEAIKEGRDPDEVAGEDGSRSLYKTFGYFSIIGLLRVHTLLGDFTLALKTMEGIDLSKKSKYARVAGAQFTIYYYVGFCYMMMRRYSDAIKAFSHILLYISRTKSFHNRSAQYDSVTKRSEQMYALLAICVALCPTRLDDSIHTTLREKNGEQLARMQRGGEESLPVFEELFSFACPKFMSHGPPDYDNPANNIDPLQHHLKVFMMDVQKTMLAPTLRSYLKLYTTMNIEKLATFLEMDPEELRSALVVFKQKSRQVRWTEGSLLDGEMVNISDLDISLEGDLINISEARIGRKFGDWFLRNTAKYYAVQDTILNKYPAKQEEKEHKDKRRERREKNAEKNANK
ncbi:RNA polymerase I-associated factor PAF67-domain-containing protein [Lipomyces tetrasporus]|uniref:Eukaryotic translation initiation factor 3 subunit L n=1 Tax=Lipomyces tetrasporus TaxID=54092 RepID=A0AAD7QLV0_9ASCO|nr:RNA polymerase I-associated factor PAF67-domain-containing protein [Lipomyces tetrasporus]KAJ8097335.1 RNA polymerase I-associated factor PAF67-domain-containing protein [Lipomyces tetrasporus]